jgi:glycine cleavage system H protein
VGPALGRADSAMREISSEKSGELSEGRVWFNRKNSVCTLGITDSAIEEIGGVDSVEISSEGDEFKAGDVLATIEGNRGRIEVVAPVAGTIDSINEAAAKEPEIVSEDPLEEGWLVKIAIENGSENAQDSSEDDGEPGEGEEESEDDEE